MLTFRLTFIIIINLFIGTSAYADEKCIETNANNIASFGVIFSIYINVIGRDGATDVVENLIKTNNYNHEQMMLAIKRVQDASKNTTCIKLTKVQAINLINFLELSSGYMLENNLLPKFINKMKIDLGDDYKEVFNRYNAVRHKIQKYTGIDN